MLAFFNLLKCRAIAYSWVSGSTFLVALYSHFWADDNIRMVVFTFLICCAVCAIASAAPPPRARAAEPEAHAPLASMEADRRAAKYGGMPIEDYLERWSEKDSERPREPKTKLRLFYPPPAAPPCVQEAAARRRLAEIQARIEAYTLPPGTHVRRLDIPDSPIYSVVTTWPDGTVQLRPLSGPPALDATVKREQVIGAVFFSHKPSDISCGPAGAAGVKYPNTNYGPRP